MRCCLAIVTLLFAAAVQAQPSCPGDCNGDGALTPDEVERAVRAVFEPAACSAADLDSDGQVSAAELLRIRIASVVLPEPCSAAPTGTTTLAASPTPTATPSTPGTPSSMWIALTPLPGGPRQEIGAAALAGRIYVMGGLTSSGAGSAAVEVYDSAAQQWSNAAALPAPRHHIGAAALGGAIYSVGGFNGSSFAPVDDVYRYDPDRNEWTAVADLPAPRGALAVVELFDQLYAIGGSAQSGSVSDHTAYVPQEDQWSFVANLPSPRNHLAAVALDGYLYAIGGRSDGGGNANSAELDRYDPVMDTWEVLAPMPTARSGHAAAVIGGRIVVMGGEVNANNPPSGVFVEVEIYDVASNTWTTIDPMAVPRHGIGAVTVGDLIYVPGGATRAGFAASDRFDALRVGP